MVGLVLVSHSKKLAESVREPVLQMMVPGFPIAIAAGVEDTHRLAAKQQQLQSDNAAELFPRKRGLLRPRWARPQNSYGPRRINPDDDSG